MSKSTWKKITIILMSVVVFATTYALILPAITMETTTFCGKKEHAHGEECYVENLVCELTEEEVIHEHTDVCYETQRTLICELEEYAGHTHTDACKQVEKTLICEVVEDEDHTHNEECYATQESYICNEEETKGHTHTDGCYEEQTNCVCTKETDIVIHEHVDGCYEKVFSCEEVEHTHEDICYSDKTADLETEADWEKTLPKELSGVWADDLITVAQSQLGYTESANNFIVNEKGKRQGYTRYGEWYGDSYGHWCAMFISFCMNYAEIPQDEIPYEASCQRWIEKLSKENYDLYKENREYIPEKGDLIFFNTDEASDSDHVGIVVEYIAGTENEAAQIKTIEGNSSNQVKYNTYYTDDTSIMGFGILPEEPQLEVEESEVEEPEVEESEVEEPEVEEPEVEEPQPEEPQPEESEQEDQMDEPIDESGEMSTDEVEQEETEFQEPGGLLGSAPVFLAEDADPNIGDKYHAPDYLYYQFSSHKLDDSGVCTFMLVPTELYTDSWTPNVKNWSAKANANYVVAYCADSQTYSGSDGVNYTTYELNDSRFTSKEQKDTLAGIIGHAYPFLTASEMKAQLKAAYDAGEIRVNVTDCIETEFIAAAQWAIWDTTNAAGTISKASGASFGNYSGIWNPLTNVGHRDNNTINSHVKAIRDWLVKQRMPEALAVADYSYTVTQNNGNYDLEITVVLNRAILDREEAQTQLKVGKKYSDVKILSTGTEEFTLEMSGLTEAEIAQAYVHLALNGEDIKTYFYDAANHQDLIGGIWANFYSDLSFDVGVETIDVSVTKQWTTEIGANSVKVQLLANGAPRGDKISLSASNDWTYTWESLPKYDLNNKEIKYTVLEDAVAGYHSTIQQIDGTTSKVNVWQETDKFENGGKYLFQSRSGILTEHKHNGNASFTWATVNLADASATPKASIWTASNVGNSSTSANLRNSSTNNYLSVYNSLFRPRSSSTTIYYTNSYLSYKDGRNTYYLGSLNTDNYGTRTSDSSKAVAFTMYKLTEVELPPSDINYLITNTKVESTIDVQINKVWEGRRDGQYPESVQVRLLQEGNAYSELVELNAQNSWSYRWSDLPYKVGEKTFRYSVEEVPVPGYTATLVQNDTTDGIQYTLTNTWTPEYGAVALQKVDADDMTELLAGAKFELYLGDELINTLEVGEDGEIIIDNLEIGETYSLVEAKAPVGYSRLKEAISFMVVKGNETNVVTVSEGTEWAQTEEGETPVLRVKNQEAFSLPDTGGIGGSEVRILGVLLILTAICILNKRKRKGV